MILFIFCVATTLTYGSMGFLFLPEYGERYGLALGVTLLIALWIYGKEIFLGLIKARPERQEEKIDQVLEHLKYKFKIPKIEIYHSEMINGVAAIDATFSSPVIVINRAIYQQMNNEEVIALLGRAVMQIKSGQALRNLLVINVLLVFNWPVHLAYFLKQKGHDSLYTLFKIFFYPVQFLIISLYSPRVDEEKKESILATLDFKYESYESALCKLDTNSIKAENPFIQSLVESISIAGDNRKKKN